MWRNKWYLFKFLFLEIRGRNITAALLTGIERDGAQEILELKKNGAFTIAQNKATSVVYGMAKIAEELGAIAESLDLEKIPYAMMKSLKGVKKWSG